MKDSNYNVTAIKLKYSHFMILSSDKKSTKLKICILFFRKISNININQDMIVPACREFNFIQLCNVTKLWYNSINIVQHKNG